MQQYQFTYEQYNHAMNNFFQALITNHKDDEFIKKFRRNCDVFMGSQMIKYKKEVNDIETTEIL